MSNPVRLAAHEVPGNFQASPAFSDEAARQPMPQNILNALRQCFAKIASLETDGVRPSDDAITMAAKWLPLIFERSYKIGRWEMPHITCSDAGEVVCEWWRGDRKLTIYFGAIAEFIKVWGTDIETEMESGELGEAWNLTAVWLWLNAS